MRVGALLLLSYLVSYGVAQPEQAADSALESLQNSSHTTVAPDHGVSSYPATTAAVETASEEEKTSTAEEMTVYTAPEAVPPPTGHLPTVAHQSTSTDSPLVHPPSSSVQSSPSPTPAPSATSTEASSPSSHSTSPDPTSPTESPDPPTSEPDPLSSAAAFLSFEEWKKKYAASNSDSGPPRRTKKTAQRARQDAVDGGPGQGGEGTFDQDGVDLGTLFGATENDEVDLVSDGRLYYESRTERRGLNDQSEMDQDGGNLGMDAPKFSIRDGGQEEAQVNTNKTSSPIQPLANVGTGDPSDPLLHLKDRSNYALFECAAMVHRSSPQSKGASSILVEKKDRYMLTPCSAPTKFVELELCDEIKIDTVVLANFEFFSSMFKHFTVKVSVNYPGRKDEWHDLGTFRARNIRGVQVFHPKSIPGFYRYMRIDFLSHYGSEYYCPVSLVRVYGLTQMDAYRKDEEQRVKMEAAMVARAIDEHEEELDEVELGQSIGTPVIGETAVENQAAEEEKRAELGTPTTDTISTIVSLNLSSTPSSTVSTESITTTAPPVNLTPESAPSILSSTEPSVTSSSPTSNIPASEEPSDANVSPTAALPSSFSSTTESPTRASEMSTASVPHEASDPSGNTEPTPTAINSSDTSLASTLVDVPTTESSSPSPSSDILEPSSSPSELSTGNSTSNETSSPVAASSPSAKPNTETVIPTVRIPRNETRPAPPVLPPPPVQPTPGESIYATIMKRLTSLEHNQTLSMHFIEAQSQMLRDAFTRVEKRLGEAEGTRSKQEQLIRKALVEMEQNRREIDRDRLALAAQVNVLSQEVLWEKRLGVAQLFGLLVILIFIGITRGAPSTPFLRLAPSPRATKKKILPDPYALERSRGDESAKEMRRSDTIDRDESSGEPMRPLGLRLDHLVRRTSLKRTAGQTPNSKLGPRRHYSGIGSTKSPKVARDWAIPSRDRHGSLPPEDSTTVVSSLTSALASSPASMTNRRRAARDSLAPYPTPALRSTDTLPELSSASSSHPLLNTNQSVRPRSRFPSEHRDGDDDEDGSDDGAGDLFSLSDFVANAKGGQDGYQTFSGSASEGEEGGSRAYASSTSQTFPSNPPQSQSQSIRKKVTKFTIPPYRTNTLSSTSASSSTPSSRPPPSALPPSTPPQLSTAQMEPALGSTPIPIPPDWLPVPPPESNGSDSKSQLKSESAV